MPDIEMLQMALVGYRSEREKLTHKIEEIEQRLGGRKVVAVDGAAPTRKRHKLSAKALANIRAAQQKRWAAFHKAQGAPVKTVAKVAPKAKKKMSAARKAALVANLAKARAARMAKRTGVGG